MAKKKNDNFKKYFGPLKSGMEYFTKNGSGFDKWKVRRRLTLGSRISGITIKKAETEDEFKGYQQSLASMRAQGFIYIKE